MNANFQVSFLPWAGIKKSIKIGPITFWPYYTEADQKVNDQEIKTHLEKYFKSYVDNQGKPVDIITVCSNGEINFRNLNVHEYQEMRNVVDILIFTAIAFQTKISVCANNSSWGPPSADVFELVTQNFHPGNDYIAIEAGSLLSGGWKIGEITFSKPWATGGSLWSLEEELIKGFDKFFSAGFLVDVRERLFRSLEWFRMSHVEGSQVSVLSKLVMMVTGLEILLQFPLESKRRYFVEYMEKHIASDDFLRDDRSTPKGKSFNLSLAGCWAWDFYELRSRIVHGDPVSPGDLIYKDWISHLIVADLIFWECLKRELFIHKCIGDNFYFCAKEFDKMFSDEPQGSSVEPLARWFLGFIDVHKALGWIDKEKASPTSGEHNKSGLAFGGYST